MVTNNLKRANHLPELVIKHLIISPTPKLVLNQVCKHASVSTIQNIRKDLKSTARTRQKRYWQPNLAIAIQPLPSREPFLIGAEAIFKWPLISGRLTTIGLSVPPSPIPIQPPKSGSAAAKRAASRRFAHLSSHRGRRLSVRKHAAGHAACPHSRRRPPRRLQMGKHLISATPNTALIAQTTGEARALLP